MNGRLTVGVNMLIASGHTGQTLESFGPSEISEAAGVRIPSYASANAELSLWRIGALMTFRRDTCFGIPSFWWLTLLTRGIESWNSRICASDDEERMFQSHARKRYGWKAIDLLVPDRLTRATAVHFPL